MTPDQLRTALGLPELRSVLTRFVAPAQHGEFVEALTAALPTPAEQRARVVAAADHEACARISALPEPDASRARALRLALLTLNTWERLGTDSSAMLSLENAGLEALVRGARAVDWYRYPDARFDDPTTWSKDLCDEVWREATFYLERSSDVEVSPAILALWSSPDWPVLYAAMARELLINVLPPASMDDEEWGEFLYGEPDELHAAAKELLSALTPEYLSLAGLEEVAGRYTGFGELLGE